MQGGAQVRQGVAETVATVCERAKTLVSAGDAGVMLLNSESWQLECQVPAFGMTAAAAREFRLPLSGGSVSAQVLRTGQSYLTHDAPHDEHLIPHFVRLCGTHNMISFKLHWQGTPIGVVHVTNKEGLFTAEDCRSLESVSPLLASSLVSAQQNGALERLHDLPDTGARPAALAAGCGQVFAFLVDQVVNRLGGEAAAVWVQFAPGGPLHRLAATDPESRVALETGIVRRALRQGEPCAGPEGQLGIPWGSGTWPRGAVVIAGRTGRTDVGVGWVLGLVRDGFQQEAVIWAQRELLRAVAAQGLPGLCASLEEILGMPAAVVDDRGLYRSASGRFVYPSRLMLPQGPPDGAGRLLSYGIQRGADQRGALVLWPPRDGLREAPSVVALLEYAATLAAAGWPSRHPPREKSASRASELDELLAGWRRLPNWLEALAEPDAAVLALVSGADVQAFCPAQKAPWSRLLTGEREDHGVLLARAPGARPVLEHLRAVTVQLAQTGPGTTVVVDADLRATGSVADSYRQCRAGLNVIRALGAVGGVYRLDLLGSARLLLETDPRELRRLLSLVRTLQVGPPERSVMLAQTYLAYLDAGENVERASAALHVHANTLRYRLGKLADLGIAHEGLDRMTLYMSLRLFVFLHGHVVSD